MEALIPIPWAHVILGERAMLRAAEMIYDLPGYVPRHWDLDEHGHKKSNKWRACTTLDEQGYINKLDVAEFRRLVRDAGFRIARDEAHSFGGLRLRRAAGRMLMSVPLVGEHFMSFIIIELIRTHLIGTREGRSHDCGGSSSTG